MRTAQEVARRIVALTAIVDHAHNLHDEQNRFPELSKSWIDKFSISDYFSPDEKSLFSTPDPSADDVVRYSWRAEAIVPLIWSLHEIDALPPLNVQFEFSETRAYWRIWTTPNVFIEQAELANLSHTLTEWKNVSDPQSITT